MAFPAVQTTNQGFSDTAASPQTLNLPSGIQSGDLLLAFVGHKNTTAGQGASWPVGWTEFFEELNDAGGSCGISGAWRVADGTETTVSVSFGGTTRVAYATYRISDNENPNTQPPEAVSGQANNSINPDPPSISPTGGAKDYLFLAMFASSHGRITSALPTDYATNVGDGGDTGSVARVGLGSARRQLNASSEDPGTFTTTGTGVEEIVFATVAIHPSSGAPTLAQPIFSKEIHSVLFGGQVVN